MKKMQDTASPGHFCVQADVNLKNFSGNPVVEYLSRFWLQGTCSGENDGYGEHDGCHAE